METIEIPAGHGRAFNIAKGKQFRLVSPKGQQSADFFAFCAEDMSEGLSPHHSGMPTRSLHPRVGDIMISRKRRPMVQMIEDGAREAVANVSVAPYTPATPSVIKIEVGTVEQLAGFRGRAGVEITGDLTAESRADDWMTAWDQFWPFA